MEDDSVDTEDGTADTVGSNNVDSMVGLWMDKDPPNRNVF
jgi:hypothetical protein